MSADATGDPLSSLSDQQTSSSGSSLFKVDDVVEGISSETTALNGPLNSVPIIVILAAFIRNTVGLDPNTPITVSVIGAEFCINYNSRKRKIFKILLELETTVHVALS